ncbi:Glutamate--tRNA ligase mitochondrial [Myotisia sp. PD_48]|nr:Glutamate--tRNA ligase mitochondrial [Myotisia sp. PD_48]
MNASSLRSAFYKPPPICKSCRSHFSTPARLSNQKSRAPTPVDSTARTRFAPSPTGYLHLGSLRTALFNYLLARRTGGQFILRVEDTDQKRTVPGAEQRLYDDLRWAGLQWDEGPIVGGPYGPYRQSERTELYKSHTGQLVTDGHAYRCFCSPERLDALARHRNELGLAPGYDGACIDISKEESAERAAKGEAHVVRLRVTEQYPGFKDFVFGNIGQHGRAGQQGGYDGAFPDPILLKSDGRPTYHLANVVDDHLMRVTHVIRGTEWMSSTPMHMALYKAFKWNPPKFGHVPLLVDKNGQKLSKRNADIDISSFKNQQEIFPETLVNFAALLGWSHNRKSDAFTLKELEELFSPKFTKGNTVVSFEKMRFLQKFHAQQHVINGGPRFDDMVQRVVDAVQKQFTQEQLASILKDRSIHDYISCLLKEGANNIYTNATDFVANYKSFFTQKVERPQFVPKTSPNEKSNITLSELHSATAALTMVPESHWNSDVHRTNIANCTFSHPLIPSDSDLSDGSKTSTSKQETHRGRKQLFHYLRWALCGGAPGIGIPAAMELLGREETVRRLQEAREATKALKSAEENTSTNGADSTAWMGSLAGAK